jgi:SAM-dependent methyltransferase
MDAERMKDSTGDEPEVSPRFWELFFDVYEALPRQGPGNRACAGKALGMCRDLPPYPVVLDLGCGVGGQTLHLADLVSGTILAVDSHAPSIDRLQKTLAERGLSHRVQARVGDMSRVGEPAESFDLVWSEGALYNIGIENALEVCYGLLRPGGYLAFTDAVWRTDSPPAAVAAAFEADYPDIGRAEEVVTAIEERGFRLLGRFTLPDEAWWDDFYTPMARRVQELRRIYEKDDEALTVLDAIAQESEMHREYSGCYAYEFFVARKPNE